MNEFMGGNFIWFHGVVEDIDDPLQLGRCRVRVFGLHTPDKQKLATDTLPWAMPMQPVTSAAVSGVGSSPTGILQGTHVLGFFRDGTDAQQPVILGTFGGIPVQVASNSGFNDPIQQYPREDYVGEQDTNRLARGQSTGTIVESKITAAEGHAGHPTARGQRENNWDEPITPYDARYPSNHVYESESGHVQEFDDTPGAERIHTYHRAGTFEEIHPDGSKVIKVVGDEYELYLGKKFVHITGNTNILIGPSEGEATENIGNLTLYVKGDADIQVDGDADLEVGKNLRANVSRQVEINSGQNMSFVAEGNIAFRSGGNFVSVSDKETKFVSSESVTIKTDEKVNIGADDDVIVKGEKIRLN